MRRRAVRSAVRRQGVAAVFVATTITVAPLLPSDAAPRPVSPQRSAVALDGVDTRARATLGSMPATARGRRVAALSPPIDVRSTSVVGVTWAGSDEGDSAPDTILVRTHDQGRWSAWEELHTDSGHGPDVGAAESGQARLGSDPLVLSGADDVQVLVTTGSGRVPGGLKVELLHPGVTSESSARLPSAVGGGVRPTIRSRADWGADERIRKRSPSYGTIDVGFVHHTAGTNSYSTSDVPGIIRGIYAYHVKSLGWDDIGYNVLVDKWGRMWEGRAGGLDRPVVGAHTLGYNAHSFGMATLGSYGSTAVPAAVESAYTSLFAWKLGLHHVDPTGTTTLTDADGSPTKVFRNISGHRDYGDSGKSTACPGTALYNRIESLRPRVKAAQGAMFYRPSADRGAWDYGSAQGMTITAAVSTTLSWRLEVRSPCRGGVVTSRTGRSSSTTLSARWDGRIDGVPAPPGTYEVTLTASSGTSATGAVPPWRRTVSVRTTAGAPPGYCPPRLDGANRYEVAVAASRETDDDSTTVVLASGLDVSLGDALVSAPLARAKGGVLLLTDPTTLPASTRGEIVRRGARTAYVVGGEAAVGPEVIDQLRGLGVVEVKRYAGRDRYEVAAAVAHDVAPEGTADILIASGSQVSMADGLVLSGPASHLRRPILLTKPDSVPVPTESALSALGVRRSIVAGGSAAVSDAVLERLPEPTRLGGASRYAVSVTTAEWANRNGVPGSDVVASSGAQASLADALSGGQLGRQLFYVRATSVPIEVWSSLAARKDLGRVTVVGGEAVVPLVVGGRLQQAVLD